MEEGKMDVAANLLASSEKTCQTLLQTTPNLYTVYYDLALAQIGLQHAESAAETCRKGWQICNAPGSVANMICDIQIMSRFPSPLNGVSDILALLQSFQKQQQPILTIPSLEAIQAIPTNVP